MRKILFVLFLIIIFISLNVGTANALTSSNTRIITDNFDKDSVKAGYWQVGYSNILSYSTSVSYGILNVTEDRTGKTGYGQLSIKRYVEKLDEIKIESKVYFHDGTGYSQLILTNTTHTLFYLDTSGSCVLRYYTKNNENKALKYLGINLEDKWVTITFIYNPPFHIYLKVENITENILFESDFYVTDMRETLSHYDFRIKLRGEDDCITYFLVDYVKAPFKDVLTSDSLTSGSEPNIVTITRFEANSKTSDYDKYYYYWFTRTPNLMSIVVKIDNSLDYDNSYVDITIEYWSESSDSWKSLSYAKYRKSSGNYFYEVGNKWYWSTSISSSNTYYFGFVFYQTDSENYIFTPLIDTDTDGEFTQWDYSVSDSLDLTYYLIRIHISCYLQGDTVKLSFDTKITDDNRIFTSTPNYVKFEVVSPLYANPQEEQQGIFYRVFAYFYELFVLFFLSLAEWIYNQFNSLWTNIFQGIYDYISTLASDIWDKFSPYIDTALSTINDSINNIWSAFDSWFESAVGITFSEWAGNIYDWIENMPNNVWNAFDSWFESVVGITFSEWASNIYEWIDNLPVDVWNALKDWLYTNTGIDLGDWFTEIYNNVKDIRSILWIWLSNNLSDLYGFSLWDWFEMVYNFYKTIYDFTSWIYEMSTENFKWIVSWLPDFALKLYDYLMNIWNFFIENQENILNAPFIFADFFTFLMENNYWFNLVINILPLLWFFYTFEPLIFRYDLNAWIERIMDEIRFAIQIFKLILDVIDKMMSIGSTLIGGII